MESYCVYAIKFDILMYATLWKSIFFIYAQKCMLLILQWMIHPCISGIIHLNPVRYERKHRALLTTLQSLLICCASKHMDCSDYKRRRIRGTESFGRMICKWDVSLMSRASKVLLRPSVLQVCSCRLSY